MGLTIQQKSLYVIIYNATQISRSLGKTFSKDKDKLTNFKIEMFRLIKRLISLMEDDKLEEKDILGAMEELEAKFAVSFGQAQKPINVILKYHFYLNKINNERIRRLLNCPIDKVVLNRLNKLGVLKELELDKEGLTGINRDYYDKLQGAIEKKSSVRIDFDKIWDEEILKRNKLLEII
ncbi:MAG: hypothetical protein WC350_04865 [Candidatus Micrarchaeia archaeon]|jgi:hypothetical protein